MEAAAQVNWAAIKETSQFSAMQPGTEAVNILMMLRQFG